MKKSIITTALLITSLLFVGCNNAKTDNADNKIESVNSEVVSDGDKQTDNSEVDSVNEDTTDNSSTSENENYNNKTNPFQKVSTTLKAGEGQPKVATIKEIVQGDLACYVTLIDEQGKEQTISASFNICQDKQFINKKVKLSYDILNFNDCQSIEPCGKTKKESAIIKMEVVDSSNSGKASGDT